MLQRMYFAMAIAIEKKGRCILILFVPSNFFEFICFVESTFLNNLALEMMMAHSNGDLTHFIKLHLMSDEKSFDKFDTLCNSQEDIGTCIGQRPSPRLFSSSGEGGSSAAMAQPEDECGHRSGGEADGGR